MHIPDIIRIHINPQTSPCSSSMNHSTIKIFHFKFLFTVQHLCRCSVRAHYRHVLKGWVFRIQTKEECLISQGHCVLPCTVVKGGCGRIAGTSLICILFRWLALVGSCRYGIFLPELKPRCHAKRHTHPHHSKILFIAPQSA